MGSLFNYPIYSQVISIEYLHAIKRIGGFSSSEGLAAALLTCTYYSICFLHLLLHLFSAPITPLVFCTYYSIRFLHLLLHSFSAPITPFVFCTRFLHLLLHSFSAPITLSVFCTCYSAPLPIFSNVFFVFFF